jgi:hypothetical protein
MNRWEKEGDDSKAACWAVFIRDHRMAVEYLTRSGDERKRILAGTVAALVAAATTLAPEQPNPWREPCQRMILGLDDPYLRIMLSHLLQDPWPDILRDEQALPLRDRLAIALRFLEDDHLTKYIRDTTEELKKTGDIEGLLLTGLTPSGMDLLQAYVNSTGDVQTAAIMASYVCPSRFKDIRVEAWVEAYHRLLDNWKLFHFRCQFSITKGQILQEMISEGKMQPFEWTERQLLMRCNYCGRAVNSQRPGEAPPSQCLTASTTALSASTTSMTGANAIVGGGGVVGAAAVGTGAIVTGGTVAVANATTPVAGTTAGAPSAGTGTGTTAPSKDKRVRYTCCSTCARTLPRCAICLMAIGIPSDNIRDAEVAREVVRRGTLICLWGVT